MTRTIPLLALLAALPAAAQAPAYGRDPADTLRYRDRWESRTETQGPNDPSERANDVVFALTFAGGDSVRARYERVSLSCKEGNGYDKVDAPGSELSGAFVLAMSPAGRVRTLAIPRFPPELEMEANLEWQFVGFFPVLPREPLRAGVAWTDADSTVTLSQLGARTRWTRTTRHRVVRDTVVGGRASFVVETEADVGMRYEFTIGPIAVRTEMQGPERGRYVFAPAPGLLLAREREGTLYGTVTFIRGGRARAYRQTYEYEGTTELLPDPRE